MTRLAAAVRRWYGAHPLHLLALLAAFALAGYAVRAVVAAGQWGGFALWFTVAVAGHDLLLFPLYAIADRSLRHLLPGRARGTRGAPTGPAGPPALNYVRIPAAISLLLLLVWFPLVLRLPSAAYQRASGHSAAPWLWHWLLVTGVLFAGSAVSYAVRWRLLARRQVPEPARVAGARRDH